MAYDLPKLPVHAYVVMVIDTTTGKIYRISYFSEPEPSVGLRYRTFVLIDREGATFEDALKAACREYWTSPVYEWARFFADTRLLRERHA